MAERVAQVIARSPVVPTTSAPSARNVPSPGGGTAGGAAGPSGGAPIRRAPDGRAAHQRAGSRGSVDAAALAAAIEGGRSGGTIRRAPEQSGGILDSVGNWFSGLVGGNDVDTSSAPEPEASAPSGPVFGSGTREERDRFDELVERTIDRIVRRVEERVIADLERRGGRYWRNF